MSISSFHSLGLSNCSACAVLEQFLAIVTQETASVVWDSFDRMKPLLL